MKPFIRFAKTSLTFYSGPRAFNRMGYIVVSSALSTHQLRKGAWIALELAISVDNETFIERIINYTLRTLFTHGIYYRKVLHAVRDII